MTNLEQVEQDIITQEGRLRIARAALANPGVSVADKSRWQACIDLYERRLRELLAARDELRSSAKD